jgi:hypothetical protein
MAKIYNMAMLFTTAMLYLGSMIVKLNKSLNIIIFELVACVQVI